jgi:hypothetical protein
MKPLRSNTEKETCSPVSSNCVVWQGPDLCCINLCAGDSISDVTHKLAIELCNIQHTLTLTDLDLKCLFDQCIACPEPEKTLHIVLQLLIDKVCSLEDIIASLSGGGTAAEVVVRVTQCLQQVDANGDFIRDMKVSDYVKVIGRELCNTITRVGSLETNLANAEGDISDLQGDVAALQAQGDPTATPTCIGSAIPTDIVEFVETLEQQFCEIRNATGTAGALLDVLDAEGNCATPVTKLLDKNVTLWTNQSQTLADSLSHMWLAICDLRGAVRSILDNCCKISCADIVIDFDVKLDDTGDNLLFFFLPKTILPNDFYDCNITTGTTFTFTDTAGHISTYPIKIADVLTDITYINEGYPVPVSGIGAVDPALGMTITSDVCVTNGDTTCVKCVTVEVAPQTTCCTITAVGITTIVYRLTV